QQIWSQNKKVEKFDFLIWGTPGRGSKNFFRTRDLHQSVSRARKPPSTKNQPIWSQNKYVEKIDFLTWGTPIGGQKNFFGTWDLRQSISRARKPPCTKNQPIWRKKNFFREAYPPLLLKNAYFFNKSKIIIPFLKPLFKSC